MVIVELVVVLVPTVVLSGRVVDGRVVGSIVVGVGVVCCVVVGKIVVGGIQVVEVNGIVGVVMVEKVPSGRDEHPNIIKIRMIIKTVRLLNI